jgi:hypothetical protein
MRRLLAKLRDSGVRERCQAKTTDHLNVNLKPPPSPPCRIVVLDEYKHQIKAPLVPRTVLGIVRVHVSMFAQSETDIPRRWGEQYQAVGIVLKSQGASDEDMRLSKSLIIQAYQKIMALSIGLNHPRHLYSQLYDFYGTQRCQWSVMGQEDDSNVPLLAFTMQCYSHIFMLISKNRKLSTLPFSYISYLVAFVAYTGASPRASSCSRLFSFQFCQTQTSNLQKQ